MTTDDIDFAFSLAKAEGWLTTTRSSFEAFLAYDPEGAFVAEEKGERIGICVGVAYERFGFLGELIVLPAYRGRGFGLKLFNHTLNFFTDRGITSVMLHGDEPAVKIYEQAGFRKVCRSINFVGPAHQYSVSKSVRPMTLHDMPVVCEMDKLIFGADRSIFLHQFLSLAPQHCFVELDDQGTVVGFISGCIGNGVVAAGPWIVRDVSRPSSDLLKAFSASVSPAVMRIDILESQVLSLSMVSDGFPFLKESGYSWKMIKGPDLHWGQPNLALSVGTPATG